MTIRVIGKALGKGAGGVAIRTHHGQGFRFAAALENPIPAASSRKPVALREQRLVSVFSVQILPEDGSPDAPEDILSFARTRIETDGRRLMHMMIDKFTAVFGLGANAEDSARRACASDLMASA